MGEGFANGRGIREWFLQSRMVFAFANGGRHSGMPPRGFGRAKPQKSRLDRDHLSRDPPKLGGCPRDVPSRIEGGAGVDGRGIIVFLRFDATQIRSEAFANAHPHSRMQNSFGNAKPCLTVPIPFEMPFCISECPTHSRMQEALANAETHHQWFCRTPPLAQGPWGTTPRGCCTVLLVPPLANGESHKIERPGTILPDSIPLLP
jgi:hypothetical protein